MAEQYFSKDSLKFLSELRENNNRAWFDEHKNDYEKNVRGPALAFIGDMAGYLPALSPYFTAQARKVGGSLMRVQRDTRFANDKTPYKTNIGIQFRHEAGKDIHAPGYYVHIAPGECFLAIGVWCPDAAALGKIRQRLAEQGAEWLAARDDEGFRQTYALEGGVLTNPPRGFSKEHPMIADLKRKDYVGMAYLTEAEVVSEQFLPRVVETFDKAEGFMRFLCRALELRF